MMKMNPKYAGIGSRSTPPETLPLIESIAARLAEKGWVLRSGGADGADSAFEKGCDQKQGTKH
jgi:predicted Rossmann fold nucleotide-binding protein DprA/Smf involved in DNA uptake